MTHRNRLILIAISLAVITAGGAFFASPYIAVRNTKRLAERGDAEALARYVDFPAVQTSVESVLTAMVLQEMGATDHTLSEFEAALVGAFVSPVVDALVSPAGLSAMLNGRAPELDDAPPVTIMNKALITMRYQGLNHFRVTMSDGADAPQTISMVFRRKGLAWRMVAIVLTGL
ncbi:MAG: DUF2939 domain-containing protein [Limnochordia bacterium]|jgi:hypothetical protein